MARFTHKRLARHPGLWRVDGIGPIEPRGRLGTRATVCFSGLLPEGLSQPYWKSSLNNTTLSLKVHSASLREFKVGSLWRDGKRIAGPPDLKTPLRVDAGRVRLVGLEQAVRVNDQWVPTVVPDANFYLGDNRGRLAPTLYALLPVLNDPKTDWLVVPTSELLRFYVGVSSRLLSGALQGSLHRYVDWARSRVERERPIVHVKQRVNRKEAAVLARAVFSSAAKASVVAPHQHLALVQTNNAPLDAASKRPLTVKANFPFTDTTELHVAGKRFPLASKNGRTQWAVFAMELLACSHLPGFSSLVLESDDPFGYEETNSGGPEDTQPPRHQPLLDDDEDEFDLDDVPADQRLGRLVVHSYSNQFSAFRGIDIEHRRPPAHQRASDPGSQIDVPVNSFTLEDGTYAGDVAGNLGISDFQNQVTQIDRDLSLFLEMLKHLRATTRPRGWSIATRKLNDGLIQDGELIAVFPDRLGKRRTWHKIVDPTGNTRTRQVVWVEIMPGEAGRYVYLLEMELKAGESGQCTILLHKPDFSRLEDDTFSELLVLTAVQNRWPDRHNKWSTDQYHRRAQALFTEVEIHRIHHPKRTEEDKKPARTSSKLSPGSWSAVLLERIDDLLPVTA